MHGIAPTSGRDTGDIQEESVIVCFLNWVHCRNESLTRTKFWIRSTRMRRLEALSRPLRRIMMKTMHFCLEMNRKSLQRKNRERKRL